MNRPTLQNWTAPPGSTWAFSNLRQLIPTAPVAAASPSRLEFALDVRLDELQVTDFAGSPTPPTSDASSARTSRPRTPMPW